METPIGLPGRAPDGGSAVAAGAGGSRRGQAGQNGGGSGRLKQKATTVHGSSPK